MLEVLSAVIILFQEILCERASTYPIYDGDVFDVYKAGLLHWKKRQSEFDALWGGHGKESLPPRVIDEAIMLCDRILEGSDDAEVRGGNHAD